MKGPRKSRRQLRDEEAGLVFAWRIPGSSFSRMVLAILIAAGGFAATASVLRIQPKSLHQGNREAGSFTVLWSDDPASQQVLEWARQQSPFPDRWEVRGTGALEAELARVSGELDAISRYQPQVWGRPPRPNPVSRLPGGLEVVPARLPRVDGVSPVPPVEELPPLLRSVATARDPLAERWGQVERVWEYEDPSGLLDREVSFWVGVEPDGEVMFCLLLDGVEDGFDRDLQRWVRSHRAAPDPGASGPVWDVVRVSLDGKVAREAGPPLPKISEQEEEGD